MHGCSGSSMQLRQVYFLPATAWYGMHVIMVAPHIGGPLELHFMHADEKMMRTKRMTKTTRTRRIMHDEDEADEEDKGGRCV